jgi:V8-like Glu-specific endopeptidase
MDVSKGATILSRPGSGFFISSKGDFLTAAHVVEEMRKDEAACPIAAITLPREAWRPETAGEDLVWFPFTLSECRLDTDLDIARCRLRGNPPADKQSTFGALPVTFESNLPLDGTEVAFTGFPFEIRDPFTATATVATYAALRSGKSIPLLVLDRTAWRGSSGSPVYLRDGRVIGIVIAAGAEAATGMTVVRVTSQFRHLLSE